jgi:hypothetical protein
MIDWAAVIQAGASIASVLVAGAATWVAFRAKAIGEQSVVVAGQSVAAAKRQVALAGVPYLVADPPRFQEKFLIRVTNAGLVPALGTVVEVMGAQERFVAIEGTLRKSGARANIAPGSAPRDIPIGMSEELRTREPGGVWNYPFLVIRLRYVGPYGARVVQSYDWDAAPAARRWRIRLIEIDPGDGGEPIRVEVPL